MADAVRKMIAGVGGLAALAAFGAVPAAAAPAPPPTPIVRPGGLTPDARPAAAPPGVVIVKDTSEAPSCTGYRSQTTPPATIRVLITGTTPVIRTVPFEQYVEDVLPNEWIASWDGEALKAGAVAVKTYAWYWVNHLGGYYQTRDNCFDVTDDTDFQVYRAGSAQARTTSAVQQTWNVVARENHQVFEASYLAYLTKSGEACGAGADGIRLSQYGTQDCADRLNEAYSQILSTYYYPGLELAAVPHSGPSAPPAGPVVLSASRTLVAYRLSGSDVVGGGQRAPGSAFGPLSPLNAGPSFVGQPAALRSTSGPLVVYARDARGLALGDGQPRVGAAFTGWVPIGSGNPGLTSDPVPLIAANGAIALYALASDGNIWGTGQSRPGASFSPWIRLSTSGGFVGKPAVLLTGAGQIVLYARNGNAIEGAGQSRAGGSFSPFAAIGSGTPAAVNADPSVIQAGDGTLAVFAVAGSNDGTTGSLWETSQPAAGTAFGSWRQVATSSSFTQAPVAHAFDAGTVAYADNSGDVQGGQAPSPSGDFSAFAAMGSGHPDAAGSPSMSFAANGAIGLYVIAGDGTLWGVGQSVAGGSFHGWGQIGG